MYRTIDTGTWDDPWVADLEPLDKLLFLYLMTNRRSTACGVFEITVKAISFETGLSAKQVDAGLRRLHPKIVWWPQHNAVWVVNFYRHQRVNGNPTTFMKSAASKLAAFPLDIIHAVCSVYPELAPDGGLPTLLEAIATHTLPTPYPNPSLTSKETVTVTEEETVTVTEESCARVPDFDSFFSEVWALYPDREGSKVGKGKTEEYMRALPPKDWPAVKKAVANYAASGRLAVDPFRFFKSREYPNGMWREFVNKGATNGANRQGVATVQTEAAKQSYVPGLREALEERRRKAESA